MTTTAPAPRTYAEARTNADAVEVVNAFRAEVPNHVIAGLIGQAESPDVAITLRLAEMVAALGTALAEAHNADPVEAFATWAGEAYDAVAQFDAARIKAEVDANAVRTKAEIDAHRSRFEAMMDEVDDARDAALDAEAEEADQ